MEWQTENLIEWLNSRKINGGSTGGDDINFEYRGHWFEALGAHKDHECDVYLLVGKSGEQATRTTGAIDDGDYKKFYCFNVGSEWGIDQIKDALDRLIAEFEKDKREKANDLETQAAILLKYGLTEFDNTRNSFVIGFNSPHPNTAPAKPLVELFMEDGALVCRFKEKEAFRIAGDGTTPESRQQLVAALREMLLKLPPEDGAKIVEHGIAVDFDAPELARLIETELAIKVVLNK